MTGVQEERHESVWTMIPPARDTWIDFIIVIITTTKQRHRASWIKQKASNLNSGVSRFVSCFRKLLPWTSFLSSQTSAFFLNYTTTASFQILSSSSHIYSSTLRYWQCCKIDRKQSVAYPGILFVGGGSTNSVEDRGQKELGSGGSSPLVRSSGGSCNLGQEISLHIVKFS